jgi:hypothetical protein
MNRSFLSSKVLKTIVRIGFVLCSAILFLWIATLKWGPEKLEKQLIISAKAELQELDRISRERDPKIPSAEEIFHTKLPIVKVELINVPLPFVFEARTEVRIIPDTGDIVVARHFFTPWRVYQLSVKQHLGIVPPTY